MRIILIFTLLLFASCKNNQLKLENDKKGQMTAIMGLSQIQTKSFVLDSNTAPKPYYIQIIKDSLGGRQLTFLNDYNNTIYFYDYDGLKFSKKITFDKNGPDAVQKPMGYHIKNMDSIYIFSQYAEILLANSKGNVSKKVSLIGGHDLKKAVQFWVYSYPEFYVETVIPLMETSNELLLTGQFSGNMPDSIIDKFKFTAHIGYDLKNITYSHKYPRSLFGDNINWGEGLFVEVFPQVHPDGKKIIYSFPISHDLYIADINNDTYKKVYAGSNFADANTSIPKKPGKASVELIRSSFVRQDMYAAILYDKYRKLYYRLLRRAIPNASVQTSWKDKTIAVIIMDEEFNYLGETDLGPETQYHWQNTFVTEEGLNIEFLEEGDIEEVNLILKIFVPKNL